MALLAILALYAPTLASYGGVWTRYTYSHGYLVPPLVLWIVWRRRRVLLEPSPGTRWAVPALGLLSVGWLAAIAVHVQVGHEGIFPLVLLAWAAVFAGWRAVRSFLPALVVFLFAVPFWEVLTAPLRSITIAVNGLLVRAAGLEAEITGPYVILQWGAFEIADACSGLNLFIVGSLLGLLYAHLFLRAWRARVATIVLAVGLAMLTNWLRVFGLVMIGHVTRMQWAYLEDHGFFGWVVFVIIFALFFPLAERIRRRMDERPGRPDPTRLEVPAWDSPLRMAAGRRLVLATLLAVLGPIAYLGLRAAPPASTEAWTFPEVGSEWTPLEGAPETPRAWEPGYADPDEREAGAWTNGTTDIHLLTLRYGRQEQGRELVGGGNAIADGDVLAGERLLWIREKDAWVREALVRTRDGPVLIWYWYRVGGVEAVSPIKAKLLELVAFLRRRPSSALVALSAACESEQCAVEREALRDFLPAD